ncbi:MAG TPA: hypothetical protein VHV78_17135, partial [Gemmatimonadaceae bacterium]|jgi:hypothetical protein|nr:hypothetical protein [Gemmatimonadaceae bacterium]
VPAESGIGVFELLVQEPAAHVHATGAALREMAPVSPDGRVFRRFLARDVPPGSVIQVDPPRAIGVSRERVYLVVGIVLLAAMVVALVTAAARNTPRLRFASHSRSSPASEQLLRRLASLDDAFEHNPSPDDAARTEYEASRTALKARLADALASERAGTHTAAN